MRIYKGYLTEKEFEGVNCLALRQSLVGLVRVESLFEEFFGCQIRVTIEKLEDAEIAPQGEMIMAHV